MSYFWELSQTLSGWWKPCKVIMSENKDIWGNFFQAFLFWRFWEFEVGESLQASFDISAKKGIWGSGAGTLGAFCSIFYQEQSLPEGSQHNFKEFELASRKWGKPLESPPKHFDVDTSKEPYMLVLILGQMKIICWWEINVISILFSASLFSLARLGCVL